jgi:hypothetical protein
MNPRVAWSLGALAMIGVLATFALRVSATNAGSGPLALKELPTLTPSTPGPLTPPAPGPLAIIEADLVERDGCLFLRLDGDPALVIWYPGATVGEGSGGMVVRFGDGSQVGPVGTTVKVVGGATSRAVLSRAHVEHLDQGCVTERLVMVTGGADD